MTGAPNPLTVACRTARSTKRARVVAAIDAITAAGRSVTFAAVARTAGVSRTLCYSDPELRAAIDAHRSEPPRRADTASTPASEASLRADLAHAREQLRQLDRDNQLLRERLVRSVGSDLDQRWLLPHPALVDDLEQRALQLAAENAALHQQVERLQAQNAELDESLGAARTMNRELITRINSSRRS